jgi:hypothetical protein
MILLLLPNAVLLPKGAPATQSRYPTRYLLLRELNDYEDEVEYTYERIAELAREMPARCKSCDWRRRRIHKVFDRIV